MNENQRREWASLWRGIKEVSEEFESRLIFIGGVAVWLHLSDLKMESMGEFSHDGDLLISLGDFADMRDLYEVTPNRRLGKNQIVKHGIEFDVYVERNYGLVVPFEDAMAESRVIEHVRVAGLEHLLVLKIEASIDRKGSEKGLKDERDLIRICKMLHDTGCKANIITPYLREENVEILKALPKSSQFIVMTGNNAHNVKPLREAVTEVTKSIIKTYELKPR